MSYHYLEERSMHITEGYLPLSHRVAWAAVYAPFVVSSVRSVSRVLLERPEQRVALGAWGAFLFTLTALRLPSVTGSSSHPTGTAVGTCLFGPGPMPALSLIVLLFRRSRC
jgi:cobalt/nickel transport system permease protein